MHILQTVPTTDIKAVYEEGKFWLGMATAVIAAYKGFDWVKAIREKDLVEVKAQVASVHAELGTQTTAIVKATEANTTELRELRNDMRTLIIQPALTRAAKASRRKR